MAALHPQLMRDIETYVVMMMMIIMMMMMMMMMSEVFADTIIIEVIMKASAM